MAQLRFEVEAYPVAGEFLVYAVGKKGRALVAVYTDQEDAETFRDFLAQLGFLTGHGRERSGGCETGGSCAV